MKNNRCGQASQLTETEYSKLRKQIVTQKYKLFLDIAWFTGERWGAIRQMKVSDIYNDDGSPRETVTFRASTRKARPDGSRETRQIPIHPNLRDSLELYQPPGDTVWLFPSRDGTKPITFRNAYDLLQRACEKAGLSTKGISTHSTRRTFITKLHKNGASPYTIKKITGHKDYKALERYIDIDSEQIKGAIATL